MMSNHNVILVRKLSKFGCTRSNDRLLILALLTPFNYSYYFTVENHEMLAKLAT